MKGLSLLLTLVIVKMAASILPTRQKILMKTGFFKNGHCQIKGMYAQDLNSFNSLAKQRTLNLGSRWQERCRNCSCTASGAWCTGPWCIHEYDFTQDNWCIEWSEDGCCCERLGCTIDDVKYDIGSEYPYGEDNPCLTCTCYVGTSREHCLRQKCGTYFSMCEDGNVTYDNNCCPQFTCPVGVSCDIFPDPFPNTDRNELMEWFGSHLEPIPIGMTQHFHLDSFNTYVCRCLQGNTATCSMETFSAP